MDHPHGDPQCPGVAREFTTDCPAGSRLSQFSYALFLRAIFQKTCGHDPQGVPVEQALELTCAGLAKKLGVYDQYKAERLNEEKTLLAKAVQDGRLTQEQADKRLANVKKRIDNCQGEMHGRPEPRNGMGKHHPRFSPMHPGPQVPPDAMQE